jgi:predicted Zn-dependent protease
MVVWLAREPATRFYHRHQQHQALERAQEYVQQGDLGNAMLSVRIALQDLPDSADAARLTADILELAGRKEAILWRERTAALLPDSLPDHILYGRTALRFGDIEAADKALSACNATQRESPAANRLKAAIELTHRQPNAAEAALTKAVAQEPENLESKLELAALLLHSTSPATGNAAREQLRQLAASQSPVHLPACRELIADAVNQGRTADARAYAKRLASDPAATFDDQIRRLNVDHVLAGTVSSITLADLQSRAAQTPAEAAQLAIWMILVGEARNALTWIESLPPAVRTTGAVRAAYASALAELKDWGRLAHQIESGDWGPILQDSIQAAMTARLLHERQRPELAQDVWQETLLLNKQNLPGLRVLLRLATLWGMEHETSATLRAIAQGHPDETWALEQLATRCHQRKDTAGLRDTFALWSELHPEDRKVQSDWIMASLLLEKGPPAPAVAQKAQKLYESEPDNAYFATIQAFSLWRQHQAGVALTIMEKLPPAELEKPGRALFYGALLAATRQSPLANRYLALAEKAPLLPEEAMLLEEARGRFTKTFPSPSAKAVAR